MQNAHPLSVERQRLPASVVQPSPTRLCMAYVVSELANHSIAAVSVSAGSCLSEAQQADHCNGEAAAGGVYQTQGAAGE